MLQKYKNLILITLGWISLVMGIIGLFLPLVPTTPFLLFTAFLFSKSSRKLHLILQRNKFCGKAIRNWEKNKTISLKVKMLATFLILSSFSISFYFRKLPVFIMVILLLIAITVLMYIWSRRITK